MWTLECEQRLIYKWVWDRSKRVHACEHFLKANLDLSGINPSWINFIVNGVLSLDHTSNRSISTRSIRKQSMIYPLGLVNTKQREFFFVSSFVLLLASASTMFLCLCLSVALYVACLTSFALPFVCPYAYGASVNQAWGLVHTETFSCVLVSFTVLKGIENNQQYKNAGKRFHVYGALVSSA